MGASCGVFMGSQKHSRPSTECVVVEKPMSPSRDKRNPSTSRQEEKKRKASWPAVIYTHPILRQHLNYGDKQILQKVTVLGLALEDRQCRPWATIVAGEEGFISFAEDEETRAVITVISAKPAVSPEQLAQIVFEGKRIGFLAISSMIKLRGSGVVRSIEEDKIVLQVLTVFADLPRTGGGAVDAYGWPCDDEEVFTSTWTVPMLTMKSTTRAHAPHRPKHPDKLAKMSEEDVALIRQSCMLYYVTSCGIRTAGIDYGLDVYNGPPYKISAERNVIYIPVSVGIRHFSMYASLTDPKTARLGVCFVLNPGGPPDARITLLSVTGTAFILWNEKLSCACTQPDLVLAIEVESVDRFTSDVPAMSVTQPAALLRRGSSVSIVRSFSHPVVEFEQEMRKYVVVMMKEETQNIRSLYLVPMDDKPLHSAMAGSFLELCINVGATQHSRCYTVTAAPGRYFRITVKHAPGGVMSGILFNKVHIGSVVEALDPAGDMVLGPVPPLTAPRPALLISGGIGITPTIAMLLSQAALLNTQRRPLIVIHGNRSSATQPFGPFLSAIPETLGPDVKIHIRHSRPLNHQPTYHHSVGHVDLALIRDMLTNVDVSAMDVFLCAPPKFMRAVYRDLRMELKVPATRIKYEYFHDDVGFSDGGMCPLEDWLEQLEGPQPIDHLIRNEGLMDSVEFQLRALPEDVDESEDVGEEAVETLEYHVGGPMELEYESEELYDSGAVAVAQDASMLPMDPGGIIVEFKKSQMAAVWEPGRDKHILEFATNIGLDIPHNCRRGECGKCALRLLHGQVTWPVDRSGQVRVCSARPKVLEHECNVVVFDF